MTSNSSDPFGSPPPQGQPQGHPPGQPQGTPPSQQGQPAFGAPPSDAPNYGQQPYGVYGQAGYGQTSYGQPGYNQAGYSQAGYNPGYGAPGYPTYGYPGMQQGRGTNPLAIVSLVLGIIPFIPVVGSIVAIVLGFVARSQNKRTGQGGSGLALAGIIIAFLELAGFIALIAVAIAFGSSTSCTSYSNSFNNTYSSTCG